MVSRDEYLERLARSLDRYAHVPDEVLFDIVTRDGACMWPCGHEAEPPWAADGMTDRELAERICANCQVRLACLELELRTSGTETLGVWGGSSEEDRRELYPLWRARRDRALGGESS